MKPLEIINEAANLIKERGQEYGEVNENFERIRLIFFGMTGIRLTSREAAMFLLALKLARMKESPDKKDHYADGINYLAFAAHFAILGE
jgi:hypothetical protein